MGAFKRQLEFLSDGVTESVKILSLDYALREAIAQQDKGTELSALNNHGQRIGAARMLLIGLNGEVSADTAQPRAASHDFPFPQLVEAAAITGQGSALANFDGKIYWIVVVPVRAPVAIAFIAACIPVDSLLLEKLRTIGAGPQSIALATLDFAHHWKLAAQSSHHLTKISLPQTAFLKDTVSTVTSNDGNDYLTVTAPLDTAAGSSPIAVIVDYSLDEALAVYRAILLPMLAVLIFALIAAVIGAMIVARGVSKPLESLAAAARRIARGDYTPPPAMKQEDELGHLAEALTFMTASIADREEKLTGAVRSLEMARGEAVQANKSKTQFLMNMSHEFRTPLNAIVGFSEMMEHQMLGPIGIASYVEYAGDIHGSGLKLLGMVDRMLDLASAEEGELVLEKEPVALWEIIQECIDGLQPAAAQNDITIETPAAFKTWPGIEGDRKKLLPAFHHLIHNAIKFSPGGSSVKIHGEIKDNHIIIQIIDQGIGMDEDMLALVVRPFHRLRDALDGKFQGAGLGLPFAKTIIEAHGGIFTLASEPGGGTTATIELPLLLSETRAWPE
jgi:signal transduction histidine kinase